MFDIRLTAPQNVYFFAALMPCYNFAGTCNFCVEYFCALSFFTWSNGLEGASGGFPRSFKDVWNPNLYVGAWVLLNGTSGVSGSGASSASRKARSLAYASPPSFVLRTYVSHVPRALRKVRRAA